MRYLILAFLLVLPASLQAADYGTLQSEKSSIVFISSQMNVPVEGAFRKLSAAVKINPEKMEAGTAIVEVDVASIDAGGAEANEEVKGKNWFDVKSHPKAIFELGVIQKNASGKYAASGKMTIKGKTLPIKVSFDMKEEKNLLLVDGSFGLKRLEYGLGSGIWGDTSVVADEVQVRFHLVFGR